MSSARGLDAENRQWDCDSDESENGDVCPSDENLSPVHLGFVGDQPLQPDKVHTLRCEYFPLGKVGGAPSWLAHAPLPDRSCVECKSCSRPMRFMLQLYAPQEPDDAFHRYLYVFACVDGACSKRNQADNIRVLRCQLPKLNRFYSAAGPLDPDKDPPLVFETKDAPKAGAEWNQDEVCAWPLCCVCGCHGPAKCGRCNSACYCGREHQAWHWKHGHKESCSQDSSAAAADPSGSGVWLWPCFELVMEEEDQLLVQRALGVEKGPDKSEEERIAEFRQYVSSHEQVQCAPGAKLEQKSAANAEQLGDADVKAEPRANKTDRVFDRFRAVLSAHDEQIVRYQLGGRPLVASSQELPTPAACELCGAARQFEFQVTPHILSLLAIDSAAGLGEPTLDFATVFVYTCSKSCAVPRGGYVVELAVKQDFDE